MIKKVAIKKFRGFSNVEFDLGSQLTVIAGPNGTQKTTLLGLLSQPFTVTEGPMKGEKPLCGGNYRSDFKQKFKLSDKFDKPKSHEWTIYHSSTSTPFTVESIPRDRDNIRFWQKGTRAKGSGYIQRPLIFLSLKRLIPIGEDSQLDKSNRFILTGDEKNFIETHYNKILISNEQIQDADYLHSPNKHTLGVTTNLYDWKQNSSGQDNLGKILLAILSFKRLKENYPSDYQRGILVIDELDATIYPGSQIELIDALRTFSSKYNIQIIFTTHSLSILKHVCNMQALNQKRPNTKDQVNVLFLEKQNNEIAITSSITYDTIKHRLNVSMDTTADPRKIIVWTEDKEGAIFAKAILKQKRCSNLSFIDCTFSCSNLIELAKKNVPPFVFPNSLVILDGDVKSNKAEQKKLKNLTNFVTLPLNESPEILLANYLSNLDDKSPVWKKVNFNFNKPLCFKEYKIEEIRNGRGDMKAREVAKLWFNSWKKSWGKNAAKVINPWILANKDAVDIFIKDFDKTYNNFAKKLGLELL